MELWQKIFLFIGALSGFLAVAAGAFGSHALKQKLGPEMLAVFEIGVKYQMYHGLALIAVALLYGLLPTNLLNYAGTFFIGGIVIFSGSLYILALTNVRAWGAVTPIGGLMLLIGWLTLLIATISRK